MVTSLLALRKLQCDKMHTTVSQCTCIWSIQQLYHYEVHNKISFGTSFLLFNTSNVTYVTYINKILGILWKLWKLHNIHYYIVTYLVSMSSLNVINFWYCLNSSLRHKMTFSNETFFSESSSDGKPSEVSSYALKTTSSNSEPHACCVWTWVNQMNRPQTECHIFLSACTSLVHLNYVTVNMLLLRYICVCTDTQTDNDTDTHTHTYAHTHTPG